MTAVGAVRARRVLLLLTFTRWFPVGLVIGMTTLLELQRGMSLSQVGLIAATQGFVVLGLELPTGGLSDAIGRRPVLLMAGVIGLASWLVFTYAHTVAVFALAMALQGVYRALDSGPLEAWYVDCAQADDPEVQIDRTLAHAGTVLGVAIAAGALISGGLVACHPFAGHSALLLPFWVAMAGMTVHLAGTFWFVREPVIAHEHDQPRWWASVRRTPQVVRDGIRTLREVRVLRCLVGVEVFWSIAIIAFETLNPIRLAELVGGETRAGAILGPISAAGWGLFSAGAVLAGLLSRRIGVASTAVVSRVLNGAFVVVMGLATGPIGLITAFLITYTVHGAANPMHATLLHRQATPRNRATVLSMNSMVAGGTASVGALLLTSLAQHTSTALAIVVAGAFSILGALLYLPALRAERTRAEVSDPRAARSRRG